MSHEKVNSGFIYGLSLAFPNESLRLYADKTHIEAIKKILVHDKISIDKIEYKEISFDEKVSLVQLVKYFIAFYRMLNDIVATGSDKIFFLSYIPITLFALKKLKKLTVFKKLKFIFVLHGEFESIINKSHLISPIILPRTCIPQAATVSQSSFLSKLAQVKLSEIPKKVFNRVSLLFPNVNLPWQTAFNNFFTVRKMIELDHSLDYRYLALSPHITKNAAKYLDVKRLNIYTVTMPIVYANPLPLPQNNHAKFAVFGYGSALVLHNILYKLSQKKLTKPYEIRIIGMDSRGTEGFSNVTLTGNGKRLERAEMEMHARDIDLFLNFYDITQYSLSCSGSILETLSNVRPVMHFDNDCFNHFDQAEQPIGICSYSFDEYVLKMEDIIENFDKYQNTFQVFRENIFKKREECKIENSVSQIREAFTWN